jgi:hypothetical protein
MGGGVMLYNLLIGKGPCSVTGQYAFLRIVLTHAFNVTHDGGSGGSCPVRVPADTLYQLY